MDARHLKDPAAGVPAQLLPHLHLVSRHKYPIITNIQLDTIVSYLLEAPKIMRDVAPVQWQFLDAPPDGTMMLTWQPLELLNTNFASDGYIWGDAEQVFTSEVRGYTLQMFWHRTGYKPGAEPLATHSRRRYRLIPSQQSIGLPQPDPAFWLVHYFKSQPRDQHPVASLQIMPIIQQQFQQRRMIQASGQLPRKEFMLHDRTNWPMINLPGGRQGSVGGAHRRAPSLAHEVTLEEEEDVSRGDSLDFMTPREISRTRYEQHHEWMEEILESPYATKQIVPPELGLGRKGTLETLTNGFFIAPTMVTQEGTNEVAGKVGKMESGKADEFTKLATQKLEQMQSELEKMKQMHIRRMENLRRTTQLSAAERKLRNMNGNSDKGDDTLENLTKDVEELVGKKVEHVSNVTCVSKGGMQDIQPIVIPQANGSTNSISPPQHQSSMQDTQQAVQDTEAKAQSPDRVQAPSTDVNVSTDAVLDAQQDKQEEDTEDLKADDAEIPDAEMDELVSGDVDTGDIDMAGLEDPPDLGEVDAGEAAEWDMVGDEQLESTHDSQQEDNTIEKQEEKEKQPESLQPPRPNVQNQVNTTAGNTPGEFDMVNDFDMNMDTAGDALADYGADEDLALDDSTFADAFHHNNEDLS